jgi:hypothetical protein
MTETDGQARPQQSLEERIATLETDLATVVKDQMALRDFALAVESLVRMMCVYGHGHAAILALRHVIDTGTFEQFGVSPAVAAIWPRLQALANAAAIAHQPSSAAPPPLKVPPLPADGGSSVH